MVISSSCLLLYLLLFRLHLLFICQFKGLYWCYPLKWIDEEKKNARERFGMCVDVEDDTVMRLNRRDGGCKELVSVLFLFLVEIGIILGNDDRSRVFPKLQLPNPIVGNSHVEKNYLLNNVSLNFILWQTTFISKHVCKLHIFNDFTILSSCIFTNMFTDALTV